MVDVSLLLIFAANPAQKQAQLDLESHILLHDCCVLWLFVQSKMVEIFPGEVVQHHYQLFQQGTFGKQWWVWWVGRQPS